MARIDEGEDGEEDSDEDDEHGDRDDTTMMLLDHGYQEDGQFARVLDAGPPHNALQMVAERARRRAALAKVGSHAVVYLE